MAFDIENFRSVPKFHRATMFEVNFHGANEKLKFLIKSFEMLPDKHVRIEVIADEDNMALNYFTKKVVHELATVDIFPKSPNYQAITLEFRKLRVSDFSLSKLDWENRTILTSNITFTYESKGMF